MHTDSAGFFGGDSSEVLCVFGLAARADRHCIRKSSGPAQAIADAQFEIGGYQQREFGVALQPIQKFSGLVRSAFVEKRRLIWHGHGE